MADLEDLYELSPMQQGMLFHSLYEPGTGLYCEQLACTLVGKLDIPAFEKAWGQVVERHAVLRTSFHWEELEKPTQVVFRRVEIPWERRDLSALPAAEQERFLAEYFESDRTRGFELTAAPLLRFALFRLGDDRYRFLFTSHHLLLDGWCMPLLFNEVFALYQGTVSGQPPRLPRPRPYRHYIAWLQRQDQAAAERFFRRDLAGITATTPLPGDRGREHAGFAEREHSLSLPVSAALQAAARAEQLTINTLVQGAWAILLARTSGEPAVIFGATVSGRPADLPDVESMIGLFINSLPVRATLDPRAGLWEFLRDLQKRHAESRQYEYTPLVDIQGWSEIPRGRPLFDSLLVFENYPIEGDIGPDAEMTIDDVGGSVEASNYPLTLMALPGERLILRIAYSHGRFDDATIERTMGQLAVLLEGMLQRPAGWPLALGDLPSLSAAERHQLTVEWNDTALQAPWSATVHALVAEQAAVRGGQVAVEWQGGAWTYAELDRRARALAAELVRRGLAPEERVALVAERGPEAVLGMLAVLQAGGAFLPIDPAWPPERAAWVIADSGARLVLAQRPLAATLELGGSREIAAQILFFEDELADGEPFPASPAAVGPDHLAYVMYTSGSTGRPKGVAVTHRNIVRLVRGGGYADLGPGQTWLQLGSLAFDAATLEIWGALANGGRLVMAPPGRAALDELGDVIAKAGVTSLWLTAGLFHRMVDDRLEQLRPLSQLLAGGDVLSPAHARRVLEELPGILLVDGYGPTEVTTFIACHAMRTPEDVGETVSIGRPVPNTQVHLLDREGRPVPIGVYGELCAGGPGVSRGYLGRPELTAESFVPDPFAAALGTAGGRLYRTGDQARYLPDGHLEFLGRRDFQVKIRGFRVELGEIENVLAGHPDVAEAAVLAREERPGEKRLEAYIAVRDGQRPAAAELRAYLADRLPDSMVPAGFTVLPALPLHSSGKVDRRALASLAPHRGAGGEGDEGAFAAPRTAVEELVARVWQQVLAVPRVGRQAHFFELGGHSLFATQISSRLRETFAVEIPLALLFEHPVLHEFASAVERRLAGGSKASVEIRPARREDYPAGFPLSWSQERQWLFERQHPGSTTYNVFQALWARGELDFGAFRRAIDQIVRRHEVLCTTFADGGAGQPVQRVHPPAELAIPRLDLSALPAARIAGEVTALATLDGAHPFDLTRGPLLRIAVVLAAPGEQALLFALHHIVSDGWSMGVFCRELTTLYRAALAGEPLDEVLPPLPLQYVDFVAWQRTGLADFAAAELGYWKRQLDGLPPLLTLPTDRPRPAVQTFAGDSVLLLLEEGLSAQIAALAAESGTTLFMILLAAFQILLGRYAGQDDLAVGTPIAGRGRVELEGLIGFFVNALVLRVDLTGDPELPALFRQVRATTLDAYAHQSLPIARLVEELQPERNPSYPPVFQVIFGLLNTPGGGLDLPGLALEPIQAESRTAKYDLGGSFTESERGIGGELEYNTDLFDKTTIQRFAAHYRNLMAAIVAAPEARLSELAVLAPAERHQLASEWNDSATPSWLPDAPAGGLRERSIPELVREQAARHPERAAVVDGERIVTYGELLAWASELAGRLMDLGVGPEVVVGVHVPRSAEMVVAVLAILEAGGIYLPLDPDAPPERLALVLADSGAPIVLVAESADGSAEFSIEGHFFLETVPAGPPSGKPAGPLGPFPGPESLAYLIYTSGSTGQPKGVAVPQGAIIRLIKETDYIVLGADDRIGQAANPAFDAATFEIWGALLSGATLVILEREVLLSPAHLAAELERRQVSAMFLTSSLFNQVVHEQPQAFAGLSTLLVGGEKLDPQAIRALLAGGAPPRRVLNGYGPTESTTFAAWYDIREVAAEAVNVPIGRPLANTRLSVQDPAGGEVPIGVAGELVIAGHGLARGYWARPELTAERFVPDPRGRGERVYRTGDLVRQLADGRLEVLRRIDTQVKLRGFRIELGEIEAALRSAPQVREAAVLLREDTPGNRRLVAYAVPREAGLETALLEGFLADKLPSYMVPQAFVELPALPLNRNGKVDRAALPPPEGVAAAHRAAYRPPQTVTEQVLAEIWAEILGGERISIDDNFFELGGHSLLAIRVAHRVRDQLGVELPVAAIFETPTIAGLAELVGGGSPSQMAPGLAAAERVTVTAPLSFSQYRLWLLDQLEPDSTAYHMPMAVALRGPLSIPALHGALAEIVRRQGSLRTTFGTEDGEPVQIVSPPGPLPLPILDLSRLPEAARRAEAGRIIEADAVEPFDLTRGPLFRPRLLALAEEEHAILATMHHIVSDGWSLAVFRREIGELYQAAVLDEPSPLPEPSLQYVDYAAWQRANLSREKLAEQLAFWRTELAGAPGVLDLPMAHPRPALATARGAMYDVLLPAELAAGMRRLSAPRSASLFMVLLAAWSALIHRYTGRTDLVIGSPIAGRTRLETEGLIGFFLNTLALRIDLSGDPSFGALLDRVRAMTLAAYTHQDIPFEQLLEELRPERDLSRTPLFQVMLNWLGFESARGASGPAEPEAPAAVAGMLTLESLDWGDPIVKFDLEIYAQEAGPAVHLSFSYNRDLFAAEQIAAMARHMEELLAAAVADPAAPLSRLALTPAFPRHRTLPPVASEVFPLAARQGSIADRFRAVALAHGERSAVFRPEESWTYERLLAEADRVAFSLLALAPDGPGPVALLFAPGGPMLAAILGTLAAGKIYVPLDPSYPRERLAYIAQDSCSVVLLTAGSQPAVVRSLRDELAAEAGLPVLDLDGFPAAPAGPGGWLPPAVPPEAWAYILYTSGSTGQPKGVVQNHRNVLTHIRTLGLRLGVTPADRVALVASYSFDAAVMDLFSALLFGAEICPWDVKVDGVEGIPGWIAGRGITVFHSTPTLWRTAFERLPSGERLPSLRAVVMGGEESQQRDLQLFNRITVPGAVMVNGLGPTESTLALQRFYAHGESWPRHSLSIGWPVEETATPIRNEAGEQVAVYGTGELLIASPAIAVGYWRRPELTAAAFVPDPTEEPERAYGGRAYRTGDLLHPLPDGSVEFSGRRDFQVKIRGVRIELGEIEAAIVAHPEVREGVVLVREDQRQERYLVAFVEPRDREVPADFFARQLRAHLAEKLPPALVPGTVVVLPQLPLTPTNKVSRKALLEMSPAEPSPDFAAAAEAPLDWVEEAIAAIWSEVLEHGAVSRRSNFFDLGGHSLSATRVLSRIREALGAAVPLRALFEAPTLAELAELVRRELLGEAGRQAPPLKALPAAMRHDLPLSFSQRRLWFLDRLAPGSSAYNMPTAVRFAGTLDVAAVRRAMAELVRRQESLRTTFAVPAEGGESADPVQVIHPAADFFLPWVDLSPLGAAAEAEARRLAGEDVVRPFDLGRGPLFRPLLVRLGERDHALFATMHHTVSDGWSMGIFVRELVALYAAFSAGRPSPLPALPLQYADFAVWQRGFLAEEALAAEIDWWRGQLAGLPARLELPADRPRPAVQTFGGDIRVLELPAALGAALGAVARQGGATLFMVLLAGFQALLSRYARQDDLAVGSPVAGRNRVELENLIGFFVNTLVLRADLSGAPSFAELVGRTRAATLGAYAHQDVPFEKLVEELEPERSLGHSPLFQVMFVLQNAPAGAIDLPDLALRPVETDTHRTAKVDLSFSWVQADAAGFAGFAEYNTDLFDAETVERFLDRYARLLESAVADPAVPVADLPLVAPAEAAELLASRGPLREYPGEASVAALFAEQVALRPEAPAIVWGDRQWSYAELDARANALAAALRAAGAGAEAPVAVALPRSPELVVALLAVVKAGGFYVPLDLGQPAERLAFVLADCGARQVVVAPEVAAARPELTPAGVAAVAVPETDPTDRMNSTDRPATPEAAGGDRLAYALYTSGSTGQPKGVLVTQRAVVQLVHRTDHVPIGPGDRIAPLANPVFDVSTFEIWGALLNGACLVGIERSTLLEPRELAAAIEGTGVTLLFPTTALFHQIVHERADAFHSLSTLLFGGEAADIRRVREVLAAGPPARLMNLYGPTEATVFATFQPLSELPPSAHTVPIGGPLANGRIALLDERGNPLPPGIPGELAIGGPGLARGYLGRPDLTAERFIPDPMGTAGERLYRTGDLARLAASGAYEFLGRIDFQVKLRGFRIELGEIEAALAEIPGVAGATVLLREEAGDHRLVAYVAGDAGALGDSATLRGSLERRLPAYMVPAAFVVLPELPLTPNGKVDRKALAAFAPPVAGERRALEAPAGPLEETLAAIWRDLLGVAEVGAVDSFFELGGHSLLATRLTSRVRDAFGAELPVVAVFEEPTVRGLARRLEGALLAERGVTAPPIVPAPPGSGPAPLSFAQRRLWFLDQMDPGSVVYNVPFAARLTGPIDEEALAASFVEIARRHEVLRTVFAVGADGEPVQVVLPPEAFTVERIDLSGLGEGVEEEALRRVVADARAPFDLARGPLFRPQILTLGEGSRLLLAAMHHIVSDGWSLGVLTRELPALYAALAAGEPSPLPPLPVQYGDYARWQRGWLTGEVLAAELEYWRERLAGLPARLELPTDRPRPVVQTYAGASRPAWLEPPLAEAIRRAALAAGATPFMVLIAGYQALLSRYAGQDDLAVGTPIAGRNRSEVEGLIGCFVNSLALRGDLAGEPGFAELLRRVREVTLPAFVHQEVPFEKLVEELAPERSLGHSPLFQVVFTMHNQDLGDGGAGLGEGVILEPLGARSGVAKYDLTLSFYEGSGGFPGGLEYNVDLFDAATIDRFLGHYARLLEGALADPAVPMAELPLFSDAEAAELAAWNATLHRPYPRERSLAGLFAEAAARAPEALAVIDGERRLTYGELAGRARRLARRLTAAGVDVEVPVGIYLPRSLEHVVAALAVLMAGGAYVPLDADAPAERLSFLLADTGAPLVVTASELSGELPQGFFQVLEIDDAEESGDGGTAGLLPTMEAPAESQAYVLYTSGSTGQPKGVVLTHRGIIRLVRDDAYVRFAPGDRVAHGANVAFDAAAFEIWGALLAGATLVILHRETLLDAEELAGELARREITTLFLTTALFHQHARQRPTAFAAVHNMVFGGEAADPWRLREILAGGAPPARLLNGYGPTESSTFASWREVKEVPPGALSIPIGRPVANTGLYVMDRYLRPQPAGVPGELLIGGDGLARGYLARPELTAEKFIPQPDLPGAPAGGRLYRTGDLVRLRPDGDLEFLRRLDGQVKLRGFRIELGEIETVVAEHPQVRQAAVALREDVPGERRLVAYVVGREDLADGIDGADLRRYLERKLPPYMVPAVIERLDALPLTPNGKLDRAALPVPSGERSSGIEYQEPVGPVERAVADLWAELLRVERVGVADNFFELGGHSLLATQVVSRLRDLFGVELSVVALFEEPTVAGLTVKLEQAALEERGLAAPPLVAAAPESGPAPLSFAQARLWFLDRLEPGSTVYNMPFALRLSGPVDEEALAASFAEVVRRHEALRTVFAEGEGGEPIQIALPPESFRVERHDLTALGAAAEAEALRRAAADAAAPFDLARGPLFRPQILTLGPDERLLLASMHHIVSDGWSLGVLVKELRALYAAFVAGAPSPLAELPVQYADYARWQRGWLAGEALEAELAYWRERLAGLPSRLTLPTDRPRPAVQSHAGAARPAWLEPELGEAVRALALATGTTPFMLLLAGFAALLSRYAGQDDLAVGTPIAGRNHSEVEGLIGFFVNTLVLRVDLAGAPSFAQLLGRVRGGTLPAFVHQELPFEKLVEEVAPERSLSHTPLFQVMFALQSQEMGEAEGAVLGEGVSLEPLAAARETAKFDLMFSLAEFDGGYGGSLEHNTDLFDAATIDRLLGHYARLLAGAVADPARPVSDLPLLSAGEREQIAAWSAVASERDREETLAEAFRRQAAADPGAVALSFQGEATTYGELDRRSEALARRLVAVGVGPDVPVGLLLERGPALITAVLGIVKAGGAYLPLDPGAPPARWQLMLADAAPPVVVTESGLAANLEGVFAGRQVRIDEIEDDNGKPAAVAVSPENLAYILYTSGSTGMPKGVAVTHGNVLRLVRGGGHADLSPERVFLQITAITFDVSTLEIWGSLLHGGRLVLLPGRQSSLDQLAQVIDDNGVDSLWLTSGLFHQMVDERLARLRPLRQLLAGGDVLSPAHVRRVLAALPELTLINGYGPTENTTFTTAHAMRGERDLGAEILQSTVPIGRPVDGTSVWILDGELAPLPVGVPGELLTGGEGLARGYFGRPELTAERFVPDPVSGVAGARLYRTGDLARWRADGTLEFLGRLDFQVKVRGFRVELQEIEAVLGAVAGVQEAAVLALGEGENRRLVGFVAGAVEPADLTAALARVLPPYMVPSAFVVLPELPLNPNGKVDRKALAALEPQALAARRTEVAALAGPLEEALAAIWRDLLGAAQFGAEDSFFELGGHSLLATRLTSRVRDAFGVELPLFTVFEAPTVRGLAERVAQALAAERGLTAPPLVPAPAEAKPAPLSFAQQRLWILDRFTPGVPAYNIPFAVTVAGPFSFPAFRFALSRVVARHEALRTRFEARGQEEPVQVIAPAPTAAAPLALPEIDLGALPPWLAERELAHLAVFEAIRRFDLQAGPVFRATFVRLPAADEPVQALLLTVHHIAFDDWSTPILFRELGALYDGAVAGTVPELPALPVQYADFALWQRRWLAGPVLAAELDYWRGQLAGLPAGLDLPTDRPRPPVQTFPGAVAAADLGSDAAAAVRALATQAQATPFMVLLAALQELLHRYSGKTDVAVGGPVANRNRSEIEGLIGFFVNTLVLRTDLAGAPSARGLVERVRQVALGAFSHQDLPFEKLVEELQPQRSLALTPFYQVVFNYLEPRQAPAFSGVHLGGLGTGEGPAAPKAAKFDLTFALGGEASLGAMVEYNTDLYDASTAQRMLHHLGGLLVGFAAQPELPVGALSLLAAGERHQLLAEWNDFELLPAAPLTLPQLVALQVARTPAAIAVRHRDEEVTFEQLSTAAGRLARRLAALGVGPEVPVGIFLERTPAMVAAMLAVLQAGGLYVPLDPTYPRERLRFTLEDSRAPIVLTHEWLEDILPPVDLAPARRIHLDPKLERWEEPAAGEAAEPKAADPENLAYLIYTSGSTGKPKGIAIAHRSAVAMLRWAETVYPPEDRAGLVATTSICFDISIFQIFLPLGFGGTILLLNNALDLRSDPYPGLARLVDTVPSAAAELIKVDGIPPSVQTLNLAGEAIPVTLVTELAARRPDLTRVFNMYGPSECTTYSMVAPVSPRRLPTPIGRPIAGTRVYLLDPEMEPVPVGVPGQVFIAGAGLARGYLDRPDQTAAGFLPDPFAAEPGARFYRTGDLARTLADGTMEFLGRIDHQVKVRGFRIELGEVEAALARHPAVAQAAVAVREDTPGDRRLVGYVVRRTMEGEAGIDAAELRTFLKQSLPDFMVPTAFVTLEKMPLNSSGKVDRLSLPAPEGSGRIEAGEPYAEPGSDLEKTLAEVLREVLGIERVGRNDNFFDLGGHSLLMIRAASALEERLGRKIEVLELFQYPSVALLAQYLEGEAAALPSQEELGQKSEERRQGRSRRREARKRNP